MGTKSDPDPYAAIATEADPYAGLADQERQQASAPYSGPKDDSAIGGAFRRGVETVKGLYHTVADPPTAEEEKSNPEGSRLALIGSRIGKGVVEGEKQAAQQTAQQFRTAQQTQGDPVAKGLGYARAGVTAASMLDPFATGSVTNVNKLSDEGRYKEALGAGTFDALSLLAGRSRPLARDLEGGTSATTTLNKLNYASGGKSLRPLSKILPDIQETVSREGVPNTIGDLQKVIEKTDEAYNQKFNSALFQVRDDQVMPQDVVDELRERARNLPQEAKAERRALLKEAIKFQRPYKVSELNKIRMYRGDLLNSFYGKGELKQAASLGSHTDVMVNKAVEDGVRNSLYDYMESKFPGRGFRDLKLKQSAVRDMLPELKDHVDKLESAASAYKGAPVSSKIKMSAVGTLKGGIHPFVHQAVGTGKDLTRANAAAKSAFVPSAGTLARRSVLALPVSSLATQRPTTVPPVPQDNDQPQQ